MKRKTISALAMALIGGSAYAASDFVDTAQVVSSTPIIGGIVGVILDDRAADSGRDTYRDREPVRAADTNATGDYANRSYGRRGNQQ